MSKRYIHIDIARGIGILLVVLGHNWIVTQDGAKGELYEMISSFHMPLFFLLSGVFFKDDQKIWPALLKGVDSLLKPYFVTLTMIGIVLIPLKGVSPLKYFVGVAYGAGPMIAWGPLWFLPHLFALHLFSLVLLDRTKLHQRPIWVKSAVLLTLLTIGYFLITVFWEMPLIVLDKQINLPGLPFSLDLVLLTGFYFLLGFLLRKQLTDFEFNLPSLLLAVASFFFIHLQFDDTIDLYFRIYDHLGISTLSALLGIYIVISLSKLFSGANRFSRLFSYIGMNSLFILIFHDVLQGNVFTSLRVFSHIEIVEILDGIVAFVAAVALSLAIAEMIRRNAVLRRCYLPIKSNKQSQRAQ